MRILIVSQYFWPEVFIINDLVRKLAEDGHHVTVATGKPNYPSGKIPVGYRQGGVQHETFADNVAVLRIPLYPRGNGSFTSLILNYLSFVFSGLLRLPWLMRRKRFDVVLVFAVSPLTAAIPAVLVSKCKRAHLALWVQDLWPESLAATGFVRNRLILGGIGIMVRWIYWCSNTLLVQSMAFFEPVSAYADKEKICYFPNFAPDIDSHISEEIPENVRSALDGRFTVVFAGNMGKAQSLSTILDAARALRNHPDIRIVFVGAGSEAAGVMQTVDQEKLTNIHFTGFVDPTLMRVVFKNADALLVTLNENPALSRTIPSKIQTYMQAGRPIIGALSGEGARIINVAGAGLTVPAGNGEGLAKSILTLYLMPAIKRDAMGAAARAFFEAHFESSAAAKRLVEILEDRMKERPA
ncbi:glycosyltransferase family 4 protein [Rhizobium laguerreae]|uniref:glycosyltransferase family 4 protein n=1 Tax=Rhizobium laguerreae TaxID=1076926 RepID=UPI001C90AC55|nr:glycosyltransferase family 4 protein [Rhizobium laguerreae]MBY3102673.1 glycosyltransferase family 4 protein [Rhizobium laguerreae]